MRPFLAEVIASIDEKKRPIIVAMCGAADLGKSHLSNNIVDDLRAKGITVDHLTLDSFLIERSERLKQGISGYQIEAYDQVEVLNALARFKRRQKIVYAQYNHAIGKTNTSLKVIEPCSILILDGVQSMHEGFSSYIDFSIFIYTSDEALKKIRYDADRTKRNQTNEFSNRNSETEYIQYKTQIEPYKINANLRLRLERKWIYTQQN